MKETVTEQKVVEEKREVIICDYCRLFTSEEVDKEFGQILLNATTISCKTGTQGSATIEHLATELARLDSETRIKNRLYDTLIKDFDGVADICPNCQEDLFGDGPASMRRDVDNNGVTL